MKGERWWVEFVEVTVVLVIFKLIECAAFGWSAWWWDT